MLADERSQLRLGSPAVGVSLLYVARATTGVDVVHRQAQLVHDAEPDW